MNATSLLFKSVGLLTKIISLLHEDVGEDILYHLINEEYLEVINILNSIKDDYRNKELEASELQALLLIDAYLNDLNKTLYIVNDLFIHKEENGFLHVQKILKSHGVNNSELIAKEVYNELFIKNSKKHEKYDMDSDDFLRDLQIQREYAKRKKRS